MMCWKFGLQYRLGLAIRFCPFRVALGMYGKMYASRAPGGGLLNTPFNLYQALNKKLYISSLPFKGYVAHVSGLLVFNGAVHNLR